METKPFPSLLPPLASQVLRVRLSKRGTSKTQAQVEKRLAKAQQELQEKDKFDVLILNDSLEKAVSEMLERVTKFLN